MLMHAFFHARQPCVRQPVRRYRGWHGFADSMCILTPPTAWIILGVYSPVQTQRIHMCIYIHICIYARAYIYIYIHIRNARLATQMTARNSARNISGSISFQRSPASMVKFSRIVAVRTFVRPTHTGTAAELYMQYLVLISALVLVYIYVAMCADDQVSRCCIVSRPTHIYTHA